MSHFFTNLKRSEVFISLQFGDLVFISLECSLDLGDSLYQFKFKANTFLEL